MLDAIKVSAAAQSMQPTWRPAEPLSIRWRARG